MAVRDVLDERMCPALIWTQGKARAGTSTRRPPMCPALIWTQGKAKLVQCCEDALMCPALIWTQGKALLRSVGKRA